VHAHAVANRKCFGVAFLLFFLNRIDDLIHKLSPAARLRALTVQQDASNCNRQPNEFSDAAT
jgi:hypothetical protein